MVFTKPRAKAVNDGLYLLRVAARASKQVHADLWRRYARRDTAQQEAKHGTSPSS